MATFVLVHGACAGGWVWSRVAPLLRAAGHQVHAPTLTGLGERAHLAHPAVGLATHVQDVVAVLAWEDLRAATLVGWGYGGMAVAGAADRVPERLARLVYLDAAVPRDGEAYGDLVPGGEGRWAAWEARARAAGEDWRVLATEGWERDLATEADRRWVAERLVPQPLETFGQPLRLWDPAAAALPRWYLRSAAGPWPDDGAAAAALARIGAEGGWKQWVLADGPAAALTAPRALAEALLALARAAEDAEVGHRP